VICFESALTHQLFDIPIIELICDQMLLGRIS
jgi:hypothetical protein